MKKAISVLVLMAVLSMSVFGFASSSSKLTASGTDSIEGYWKMRPVASNEKAGESALYMVLVFITGLLKIDPVLHFNNGTVYFGMHVEDESDVFIDGFSLGSYWVNGNKLFIDESSKEEFTFFISGNTLTLTQSNTKTVMVFERITDTGMSISLNNSIEGTWKATKYDSGQSTPTSDPLMDTLHDCLLLPGMYFAFTFNETGSNQGTVELEMSYSQSRLYAYTIGHYSNGDNTIFLSLDESKNGKGGINLEKYAGFYTYSLSQNTLTLSKGSDTVTFIRQ